MIFFKLTHGRPQDNPEYLGMNVEWFETEQDALSRLAELKIEAKADPWLMVGAIERFSVRMNRREFMRFLKLHFTTDSI